MTEAASLRCLPALAARRPEKGSAALDDIPHIHRLQFAHILFEQTVVAVVDSPYMNAFIISQMTKKIPSFFKGMGGDCFT